METNDMAHSATKLNDIHVNAEEVLITPEQLRAELPLSEEGRTFVSDS